MNPFKGIPFYSLYSIFSYISHFDLHHSSLRKNGKCYYLNFYREDTETYRVYCLSPHHSWQVALDWGWVWSVDIGIMQAQHYL